MSEPTCAGATASLPHGRLPGCPLRRGLRNSHVPGADHLGSHLAFLSRSVEATTDLLEYAILGTGPLANSGAKGNHCEAVLAYTGGAPGTGKAVGLSIYFFTFSTWTGKAGLYLEDLFVDESMRGQGVGKALFQYLGKRAKELDCPRMDWVVLESVCATDSPPVCATRADSNSAPAVSQLEHTREGGVPPDGRAAQEGVGRDAARGRRARQARAAIDARVSASKLCSLSFIPSLAVLSLPRATTGASDPPPPTQTSPLPAPRSRPPAPPPPSPPLPPAARTPGSSSPPYDPAASPTRSPRPASPTA